MIQKKNSIACVLCISLIMQGAHAGSWNDVGKPLMVGGAIVAGIGGLIGLGSWLTSESDEHVLERAQDTYQQLKMRYQTASDIVYNAYALPNIAAVRTATVAKEFNESMLYDLAVYIDTHGCAIDSYLSQLNRDLNTIFAAQNSVRNRIQSLRSAVSLPMNQRMILQDMDQLIRKIKDVTPYVSLLRDVLAEHKSYFRLFAVERYARKDYDRELQVVYNGQYNHMAVANVIRYGVNNTTIMHHARYPFIRYVSQLQEIIKQLKSALNHLVYNYAERINWARSAHDMLKYLHDFAIAMPEYQQQVYMREQDRKEQLLIDRQKEQLKEARKTTALLEEQNRIKREELRLREQELREKN